MRPHPRVGRQREMMVGLGYDRHALVAGRPLVLGGLTLAHARGLRAEDGPGSRMLLGGERSGAIRRHVTVVRPSPRTGTFTPR